MAALLALTGCGAATNEPLAAQPFTTASVQWQPCPGLPVRPGGDCALLQVPKRWDHPERGNIDVLVRKFSASGERRGQVWMLDGGPGSAGAAFADTPWFDLTIRKGFELFIPTHRGVALSTRLSCPAQEHPDSELGVLVSSGEEAACGAALSEKWGDDLSAFTAYEAARDIEHVIERTRLEGTPVYIWGGSYGTVWAQRLLALAPSAFAGVVLEGAVPPAQNFELLSQNLAEGASRLLSRCGDLPACASHFSAAPLASAAATFAKLRAGAACDGSAPVTAEELQLMLAFCMIGNPPYRRVLAPLLARLERCSPVDHAEIVNAKAALLPPPLQPLRDPAGTLFDPRLSNPQVATQIIQADLLRVQHSRKKLEQIEASLIATTGNSLRFYDTSRVWPHPPYEQREALPAATTTPILVFAGELDAQTPLSWSERTRDAYPSSLEYVEVPGAGHMTYAYAWTNSHDNCNFDILSQFLNAPTAALDTSCLSRIVGLDYAGTSDESRAAAREVFGPQASVWP